MLVTQLKAQGPSRICNESKEKDHADLVGDHDDFALDFDHLRPATFLGFRGLGFRQSGFRFGPRLF